jgi:hypothetical protein
MAMLSRTVEQKTNYLGFPKPGELIEMTGTHVLEASDRAILNILYQHAHDSGKLLQENAEWEIPLSTLRQAFSKHESSDRLKDSLNRLMTVKVWKAQSSAWSSQVCLISSTYQPRSWPSARHFAMACRENWHRFWRVPAGGGGLKPR